MGSHHPRIEIHYLSRRDMGDTAQWRIMQSVDHNQNPPPSRYFLVGYRMDRHGIAIVNASWTRRKGCRTRIHVATMIDEKIVEATTLYLYEASQTYYGSWERSVKLRTRKFIRELRKQTGVA